MGVYEGIAEKLGTRASRKIGNNTYLQARETGRVVVRLHDTDILTFEPDGAVVYNSGGWRTPTTKARLNEHGPEEIRQKAGIWYICGRVYRDGCTWKAGKMTGTDPNPDIKKLNRRARRIRAYCQKYMEKFLARQIPAPTSGDCWGCLMKTTDGATPMGGPGHMLTHLKEKYFVPSLIVRAEERFPVSIMAKNIFAYIWSPEHNQEKIPEFVADIAKSQLGKSLLRHVKRELGIAA